MKAVIHEEKEEEGDSNEAQGLLESKSTPAEEASTSSLLPIKDRDTASDREDSAAPTSLGTTTKKPYLNTDV